MSISGFRTQFYALNKLKKKYYFCVELNAEYEFKTHTKNPKQSNPVKIMIMMIKFYKKLVSVEAL